MNTQKPLVSICTLTYNHASYLRKCLDSLLMQKTNFAFEILINDDKSTDETQEIIKEYHEKYPEVIKPLLQEENQYSQGKRCMNARFNFPRAKGKYLAMCEGDDYWTDELKLQKQVDFLEQNPDYSICFHDIRGLKKDKLVDIELYGNRKQQDFTIEDLLKENFIPNISVMYRNVIQEFPDWYFTCPFGDYPTHILHAMHGKIHYINQKMAVYRMGVGIVSQFDQQNLNETEIKLRTIIAQNVKQEKWRKILSLVIYDKLMNHYNDLIPNFKKTVKWRKFKI